jgi:ATP-binding cassette subfamily B protein
MIPRPLLRSRLTQAAAWSLAAIVAHSPVYAQEKANETSQAIPPTVSAADYADLLERPPFRRLLSLSESLVLSGVATLGSKKLVTIWNRATSESLVVTSSPNPQGWRLAELVESTDLRHVTATVEAGETLALVGATGSGKSVLAALLPRLFDVTEGAIRIDGVDIRELTLPALRGTVAVAFEDPTLFSMSVAENLMLGRPPGNPASPAEVDRAIEIAAAQFVYDLPFGLQTRIGEQGMSLSGGQRQRLALARAILAEPKVLVLDDTLSALDVHTEAVVTRALREALAGVTAVVVAHRASTVQLADRVALLDSVQTEEGMAHSITHIGTHAELLAEVPRYRYLLAADDDLDDGSQPHPCWEEDSARRRLQDAYEEAVEGHQAALRSTAASEGDVR